MKYLNAKLLTEKDACEDGFNTFKEVHGDKDVTWLQALESNGWDDIWWAISVFSENLTDLQNKDLCLLAAGYAEDCIQLFEKENPEDSRPRLAIEAARKFVNGEITKEDLAAASAAAWAARASAMAATRAATRDAGAASWAATRAAGAASWAAGASASAAASAAAWAAWAAWAARAASAARAARAAQTEKLKEVLLGWV